MTPEERKAKAAAQMRRQWQDPAFAAKAKASIPKEVQAERMRRRWKDPAFAAKVAAASKRRMRANWENPTWREETDARMARYRNGDWLRSLDRGDHYAKIGVPPHLVDEYKFLTRRKRLSAAQAREIIHDLDRREKARAGRADAQAERGPGLLGEGEGGRLAEPAGTLAEA